MTILEWEKLPIDGSFATQLRREIRTRRREKGRAGHEFMSDDIRVLWASGASHVILAHNTDRVWQFWWRHPQQGWFLQSWHRLLVEAKTEADKPRITTPLPETSRIAGTYVCAEWKEPHGGGSAPMMVRCSTQYTVSEILSVFQELGCNAVTKAVV
jgi:hypothetical protein